MTKEELIAMALQAGMKDSLMYEHIKADAESLAAFAKLVAEHEGKKYEDIITNMAKLLETQQKREGVAVDMIEAAVLAEREACAQLCEASPEPDGLDLADRIRAREQA